ncbi:MAG: hypothetical protein ACP5TL_02675 [Candidatus Micrarchaeia archaeon]
MPAIKKDITFTKATNIGQYPKEETKMKISLLSLALTAILLISVNVASTETINASVLVQCPFALNLTMKHLYIRMPNQEANFTVFTYANCTIPNMNGMFIIQAKNGSQVYFKQIQNVSASTIPSTYNFSFNPSNISAGSYFASLSFTYALFSKTSKAKFLLGNPSNITIENFSTTSSLPLYAPQQFLIVLKNTGSFAISNSISVKISTFGPSSAALKLPSNYSLLPSQNVSISVTMYNSTQYPGSYTALLNVTYPINGTNGTVLKSSYKSINYIVLSPPAPPHKPVPVTIKPLPAFSLMSFPFFEMLLVNKTYSSVIDIKNNANVTEYVNLSIPSQYSMFMGLSATRVSIEPHQTIGITAKITAPSSMPAGQYIIPINISASLYNKTSSETIYTTMSISNTSTGSALPSVNLLNNTNSAAGTVEITNPTGLNLSNVQVKTILPAGVVTNVSQIGAYGLPYSISMVNGSYVVTWSVGALPRYSSTYAYISLSSIKEQNLLTHVSTVFSIPSPSTPSSILKIIDINTPTFYANSTGVISVTGFYTGTLPQHLTISLSGPPNIYVYNSTQYANMTPNMVFMKNFFVTVGQTGTVLLDFYASTQGANVSYTIPILVISRPITSTTSISSTTIPIKPKPSIPIYEIIEYAFLSAIFLIIVSLIVVVSKRYKKPKYDSERAEKLKEIREEIKRSK